MSLVSGIEEGIWPSKGAVVCLIDEFMEPRDGFGRFAERIAVFNQKSGNEIKRKSPVEKIVLEGNRVKGVQVRTEEGSTLIEGDNFISSIPLTVLVKITDPPAPQEVIDAANSLVFRDIITVNMMFRKRQVTND